MRSTRRQPSSLAQFTAKARGIVITSARHKRRAIEDIDEAYCNWIRSLPCIVCFIYGLKQTSRTECAHVGPERGMGQKCPDRQTLPLCFFAHHQEGPLSAHELQKGFWPYWKIDRDSLIASLNEAYDAGVPFEEWTDDAMQRLVDDIELLDLVEPKSGDIARSLISEMEACR